MEVRYKLDRSKMKVGYNDGGGDLRSGKIEVRWRLDRSKIEVGYNEGDGALILVRMKEDGG